MPNPEAQPRIQLGRTQALTGRPHKASRGARGIMVGARGSSWLPRVFEEGSLPEQAGSAHLPEDWLLRPQAQWPARDHSPILPEGGGLQSTPDGLQSGHWDQVSGPN